ncbi:MAG: hypothetical protein JXL84_10615 [Deltaproteobacteria bacterium]|nr:hypothetical protein [Deltaproteobacteria bacterium]
MAGHRESLLSAHHNYLVNDMLSPGFVLGSPGSKEDFWFLADVVPPGEVVPRISGRLFSSEGEFLVSLRSSKVLDNPGGCVFQGVAGGFRLLHPSGEVFLSVHTQVFTNGYLTRIQGKLYDRDGTLRMESSFEGVKVYGEARLALERMECWSDG